jgi:hypothetical protein
MQQRLFMDLLEVAWDDFHAHDRQSAVGMVIVVIHKDEQDDMGLQIGANTPPEVIQHAFRALVASWDAGDNVFQSIEPAPIRKVV